MPELSIIVPVYKVEPYLSKCIDSILAQTFTDFELILIDDGSPDRCGEISDEYASKDDRIVVIHQNNQGVGAARNVGLKIAKGSFLGFVDSDDWIKPEMYSTMISLAKEKTFDIVMCGADHWSEDGELLYHDLREEQEYTSSAQLVVGLYGAPSIFTGALWNKIYSRKCVADSVFEPSLKMAEDWLFLADVLHRANRGIKIAAPLYNYLERSSSVTRSNNIEIVFDHIFRGRYLLYQKGQCYTKKIAQAASYKYLDDCLRYTPELIEIGRENSLPYRIKLLRIKCRMLRVIICALFKRTLPIPTIHGFLSQTIHL